MPSHAQHKRAELRVNRGPLGLVMTAVAVLLGACSSGSGGTDVTIGSGQNMDPVTLDFPVFYVKRPVPDPEDEVMEADARELMRFDIGADLFMRDRASPSAPEINLTEAETEGLGDIRDVDVNYEGNKVLFSMRAQFIEDADEEDQPTWNIWEYDTTTRVLRRIITSDTTAEEGHDIMPHYLPDGRIVFSSTRQRQARAILLDENKPQYAAQDEDNNEPAFVLHVMDADGTNINQISFNQSHDLDPAVLGNGQIVFTRWEHHIDDNQFDLYKINPDGTGLELLYGAHSHNTGTADPQTGEPSVIQFLNPRPMQDGRTLALIRPFEATSEGGDLVLIDTQNFVNNTQPTAANAGMTGPAQARALPTDVRTIPGPSPGGRYRMAAPLFDGSNRLLVSWSQCRLIEEERIVPCTSERLANPDAVEAPPLYGIYIYDVRDNTQRPVVVPEEGFIYTEVVAGAGRPDSPPVILDRAPGVDFPAEWLAESVGVLHIRSVYDIDGVDAAPGGINAVRDPANPAYANRPARFLRIEKAVSQPDDDVRDVPGTAFGPNRSLGMRDILGYAPIEPDGSVKVKIPANVAFGISVLDANGRRLPGVIGSRHTSWLQVKPGEQLECNGCHNAAANPPIAHGRSGLFVSVNAGAPTTGSAFPNTNTALFADMGETMAEARSRIMCDGGACEPSVHIGFTDYWPANPAAASAPVDMCYSITANGFQNNPADPTTFFDCGGVSLGALPSGVTPPTSTPCLADWSSLCRITIHYVTNIAPLWTTTRLIDANGDGLADTDVGGNVYDSCVDCHSPTNLAAQAQVPAGDLDLRNEPSENEPDHFVSYRELLFGDRGQILNAMGQLEDECLETVTDPVTLVVTCVRFRNVPASMNANGARSSARFFDKMEGVTVGTVDHSDFMSPSELRLISEWLDIGAQYYNDPFVAPEN